ncbi:MAG: polyamine aminopropyltransferase [Bdellovibrionales bacterium]|nr:polyamine aminopropyltransferase [Bdellovibrionales bacterium]
MPYLLLFSVFVIATCGLIYELISGALASYLLGDSITQFSTVIGVYLFSMGIGSFLSKYVRGNLVFVFIQVELLVGLVGGCSAAILFTAFEHVRYFRVLLYLLVTITGTLVGLEIPLLMRILKDRFEFKDLVSQVFTFDYVGALLASLLFPLVLVPHLGMVRTGFFFGILNAGVALWVLVLLGREVVWARLLRSSAILILILLVFGFVYSDKIMSFAETASYQDQVIYSKSSRYQRIVITRAPGDLRLFLNGNLQFSSRDEYRYHEALVHVGLAALPSPRKVLVLGGGDGLAVREILKYPSVESVTLVDLDSSMTDLFRNHDSLTSLNGNSLKDPKVRVLNEDAFVWLRDQKDTYDFIAVDFPDPSNYSIGKLYSNSFYRVLKEALAPQGILVIQSTSPYVAKKSFWCVENTLKSTGLKTVPYHAWVPSFGEWGFVIGMRGDFRPPERFPAGLRFVNADTVKNLLYFPDDMIARIPDVNKLNNQVLVRYFEHEWSEYIH